MTSPASSCAVRSVLVALDDATSERETMEVAVALADDYLELYKEHLPLF